MSNLTKIVGAAALGLGVAVAIPVLGHGFGAGMHGNGQTPGAGHHMGMYSGQMQHGQMRPGQMHFGGNIEVGLSTLKQSLKLTTEQQPAWDQYEQAVKNMVDSRPAGHPNWGNADEHYAQMEKHFTQMKAVFDAQKALYDTLTDEQKQKVNNTMPGPFGHHHGYNG